MTESATPKRPVKGRTKQGSGRRGRTAVRFVDKAQSMAEKHLDSLPNAKAADPKTKRRGDDVRARVLQAALECFGAFGFEGTSTRAVAARANITHTLVLYHFQSKDQLWIATMQDVLGRYVTEMKENFDRIAERPAQAGLKVFIEQFVRMSAQIPQMHRILTMESNQGTARLQWVVDHFLRDHYTLVRNLIRRGQTEGTVRECDPARLYYLIIAVGGTPFTISTEYKALTGRDVFSEAEILRNIAFMYELVFV